MSGKKSIEADNPHPPGTLAAAGYDLNASVRRLGGVTLAEFLRQRDRIAALLRRQKP